MARGAAVAFGTGWATTFGVGGGCAVQLEAAAKADKRASGMAAKRRCSMAANLYEDDTQLARRATWNVRGGGKFQMMRIFMKKVGHAPESFPPAHIGCCGIQDRMAHDHADDARRRLPVIEQEARTITTQYSPDVLAGIALGEAAVLEPLVGRDVQGAVEAADSASARAEQLIATALHNEPPEMPIACRRGCSTCCQAKVLIVAPEALRIGEHLRKTKTADELATLLELVRQADTKTRGLSRAARADAHIACPLLDAEGGCSIHEVRPLVCRSWTSYDARACETYWQSPQGFGAPGAEGDPKPQMYNQRRLTPPQWPVGYELAQAMLAGLGKACLDRGLDGVPLEFIAALRIVLERPNAGERWPKKVPVFMAARDAGWAEANGRG